MLTACGCAAGHSLGGALAELAAHALASRARAQGGHDISRQMVCYTFGAPRVGNQAWAAECGDLVPTHFHVITDQVAPRLAAYAQHGRPCPGLDCPPRRRLAACGGKLGQHAVGSDRSRVHDPSRDTGWAIRGLCSKLRLKLPFCILVNVAGSAATSIQELCGSMAGASAVKGQALHEAGTHAMWEPAVLNAPWLGHAHKHQGC